MLKRNLFAIIIAGFVFVFTGNAFGQWHPEIGKVKRKVKTTKIKPQNHTGFTEVTGLDIQVGCRNRSRRKSAQYNPKEVSVDKIKARKLTSFTSAEGRSMSFELRRKQPRKRKH